MKTRKRKLYVFYRGLVKSRRIFMPRYGWVDEMRSWRHQAKIPQ